MIGTEDRLPVELDEVADDIERLVHSDPAAAEVLALSTLHAAARQGLAGVEARVSYTYARLRAERGELDDALELIARARTLWEQEGEVVGAARTDLGTMQILDASVATTRRWPSAGGCWPGCPTWRRTHGPRCCTRRPTETSGWP